MPINNTPKERSPKGTYLPEPPEQRFWRFVNETDIGCWEWFGAKDSDGYGQFYPDHGTKKHVRPHRYSFELANGPIPPGLLICHTCDNPLCVRPEHLFAGTPADNSKDMVEKGRSLSGERHPGAKLNWDAVNEIRRLRAAGTPLKTLMAKFGVSKRAIQLVVHNKTWTTPHEVETPAGSEE